MDNYIRSTKVSTKFSNIGKKDLLVKVYLEYSRIVQEYINYFWCQDLESLPKYCSADDYNKIDSILGSNLRQEAGKQALAIVRGTFQKQKQRIYVYNQLLEKGDYKKATKLKQIIDNINITCPIIENIPMELGGYVSTIILDKNTYFDGWVRIQSLFNRQYCKKKGLNSRKQSVYIPFKKTKHFNKMIKKEGKLLKGILLTPNEVSFRFEFEKKVKEKGETLGVDIGLLNTISCSNGHQTTTNKENQSLESICKKIARKKKGSKNFNKAVKHRDNYINWSINQLNLENISEVKRENIKKIRKHKRNSRLMQSWTYTDIFDKLDRYCEEQDVLVTKISPTYTSQRCSECGWTRKGNRKGKTFTCDKCGNTMDSDLNASLNISFNLREIGKKERLLGKNKTGFYWNLEGKECIAPSVNNLKVCNNL